MKLADLLKEFNVVIDTTEGLTELRSLILGLAVRGKLVPQDPNDEPASELLDKIVDKRHSLFEEGKIRKPKKLSELSNVEVTFAIPDTWAWARLGKIVEIGSSSRVHKKDWKKEGIPFLRAREIVKLSNNGFVENELFISKDLYESLIEEGNVPEKDDFMITGVGTIGVPYIVKSDDKFYFKDASVLIFKNFYDLYPNYLFYLFKSPLWNNTIHKGSMGTTVHTFTITRANDVPIPFPPIKEQHRIVQKIESLFAEVDDLEAKLSRQTKLDEKLQLAVNAEVQQAADSEASKSAWNFITANFETLYHTPEAIDNLKKNILNEAVRGRLVPQNPKDEPATELLKKIESEKQRIYEAGEIRKPKDLPSVKEDEIPFEIPESWGWCRLGDVYGDIGTKTPDSKFSYIDVSSIDNKNYRIDRSKVEIIDSDDAPSRARRMVKEGSLIYSTVRPYLLNVAIVENDFKYEPIASTAFEVINVFEGIFNKYLYRYLLSNPFIEYVNDQMVGVAYPAINKKDMQNSMIPIPPLDEQHRIVRRIEELFAICDRFKAQQEQRQQVNEKLVKGLVSEVLEGV